MRKIFVLLMLIAAICEASDKPPVLPGNRSSWLDQQPISWNQLRGKVVMLNVWTFGCVNCHQTLPWVVSLQKKYPSMQIIGIHTPEFSWEKDRGRLREEMKKSGMNYPQVLDDNYDYWNALGNSYWPSFYVVDKKGIIRGRFFGETHINDNQATKIEGLIKALAAEPQK